MVKKLSLNIFIYGGINAIRALVPFLLLPILTLYFTKDEYGTLSIIEITILFLAPFLLSGISGAINTEYFHLEKEELKLYISNSLLLASLFFIILSILLFFSKEILSDLLNIPTYILSWLPFFAFARIPITILLGILQVKQEPIKYGILAIFQASLDLLLAYIFVVIIKLGYIGRLEAMYGTYILVSIISLVILFRMDLIVIGIVFKYTRSILKFVLPLIPHILSGVIIAYSDRYFISYYQSNSEVGYYTVAYQVSSILVLIAMSVNQAWTPMLLRLLKTDINQNMNKIIIITLSLIVGYIAISYGLSSGKDILFDILIDSKFYDAKQFFPYLLLGFLFQSIYMLFSSFFFFYKKTAFLGIMTLSFALINLILNYFLIQIYDSIGVAYATTITWFLFMISTIFASKKLLKNKINL